MTQTGICDVCEIETDVELHYGNMYFCSNCWIKEQKLSEINQSPEEIEKRLDAHKILTAATETKGLNFANEVLRESKEIDTSIRIRSDLFNAKTVAILEIKKAIDSDETIENKPYELAKVLLERFNHLKTIVFELNQQLIDAGNEQKAIQVHLNTLANQLRQEEREKLKIADINYKPSAPVKKIKAVTTRQTSPKTKIDKKELRDAAAKLGIAEFTLQMICVQKNLTVKDGMEFLLKMKESK